MWKSVQKAFLATLLIILPQTALGQSELYGTDLPNFFPTDLGLVLEFPESSDELSDDHKTMLQQLVQLNQQNDGRRVTIVAWGDPIVDEAPSYLPDNILLAQRRIEALRSYFSSQYKIATEQAVNMEEEIVRDAGETETELKNGEREMIEGISDGTFKVTLGERIRAIVENGGPGTVVVVME